VLFRLLYCDNCKTKLSLRDSVKITPIKQQTSFCYITRCCALLPYTSELVAKRHSLGCHYKWDYSQRMHWYNQLQLHKADVVGLPVFAGQIWDVTEDSDSEMTEYHVPTYGETPPVIRPLPNFACGFPSRRNQLCQILSLSPNSFWETRYPKIYVFPLTWEVSFTTAIELYRTELCCDFS